MVEDARAKGASVLCGGREPEGPGWFYEPTAVGDLTTDMAMYADEVFGPVAGLYRVGSIDEAVDIANSTSFGLGAVAWTEDAAEQQRFVRDLDAGAVTINGMTISYPELPFGGTKRSGYGRELSGHGIREFCNIKTVWVA
jgi:succinate-semialdehyde dehydrogenase/glutarate-semialdehyde dehydrogenase